MRSVQVSNQFINGVCIWYFEITIYQRATREEKMWEICVGLLPPKYNALIFRLANIAVYSLEVIIMPWGISDTELRQFTYGIPNFKPESNACVQKFTHGASVWKSCGLFIVEGFGFRGGGGGSVSSSSCTSLG
jgi:hypothetical protein